MTAGPTHEPIDAVRYVGNRSSGRMGIAIADASARRGHPTTLLLGPTALVPSEHSQITVRRFRTTAELQELLRALWPSHEILIMAAAVADYRPRGGPLKTKISRQRESLTLELEATPDLLEDLAKETRANQTVIGFALEPRDELPEKAREKLQRKQLDAIVANPLETMESPTVTAHLFLRDGTVLSPAPESSKEAFAEWLLDRVEALRPPAGGAKR